MSAGPLAALVGDAATAEGLGRLFAQRYALARLLAEFLSEASELRKIAPEDIEPGQCARLRRRIATLRRWDAELATDIADAVSFGCPTPSSGGAFR